MSKGFKITLIISLSISVLLAAIQIFSYFQIKKTWEANIKNKYKDFTRVVDVNRVKKAFLDSLHLKYPETKDKKYIFINTWGTGASWSIRQLPFLDTLIEPLNSNMAYILVNDEKPDYSAKVLKQDSATTKNFRFMHRCEEFIFAVNQELLVPRKHFAYPVVAMNLILDPNGKIIFSDTLGAISGPKTWPEEEKKDKEHVAILKKKLAELK
jgi:hypothetical protein